eukprot:3491452-Rhodomonas_salina.2
MYINGAALTERPNPVHQPDLKRLKAEEAKRLQEVKAVTEKFEVSFHFFSSLFASLFASLSVVAESRTRRRGGGAKARRCRDRGSRGGR